MRRTSRPGGRWVRTLLAGVALTPALVAALVIRPAPAHGADAVFGLYALTMNASGASLAGDIGAGGGLAALDGGVPYVDGRLDSSPSGAVRAAAVQPGALVQTVAGQVNGGAGQEVVSVPMAEANYPGQPKANGDIAGSQQAGPLTVSGLTARATADQQAMSGTAAVTDEQLAGGGGGAASPAATALTAGLQALAAEFPTAVTAADDGAGDALLRLQGATATGSASADPGAGTLHAVATSTVGRASILGQINVRDVVGSVTVNVEDGARTATGGTTLGGITIGGVPVTVSDQGVSVQETPLLPGQQLSDLNDQLNTVLENAGVTLQLLAPRKDTGKGEDGAGHAAADSGGLRVTIASAATPQAGLPGNHLTIMLGVATVTAADEPPIAAAPPTTFDSGDLGTSTVGTTDAAGSQSFPDLTTGSAPAIAAPADTAPTVAAPDVAPPAGAGSPPIVMVAGRQVSAKVTLAAFGGWQLLSLSICTLAAYALRGGRSHVAA